MTDIIDNQPPRRPWVKMLLSVGALLLAVFLIVLTVVGNHSDEAHIAEQDDQRLQHIEEWRQAQQDEFDTWHAREADEVVEDTPIVLSDDSPGVERCHYVYDLVSVPGEYYYQLRPQKELTHCEELPYDPQTNEVG